MAGEGPPFLTVGTDVSAKYRGAFCEAKVKVVKKLVKCKINFKSGTSCIVSDDFVKGTLKIGAKVEAKMTESGPYEDGIIMKLNDASLYTVVFDDGDEKTLRRTLLCLQGEKHFHESETLDHLPLTDPENFGTPVVKDRSKTRRKRRTSNRSQRSEDEEEEEEEDDEDSDDDTPKKQRKEDPEDAVGKIVIVEMNEKRKNSFFPALIVDPSCTKDLQTKGKDYIVTRSFKDNKFYTVTKSNWKPFLSKDHTYKGDVGSLKAANEKAVTFIDTGQLPSNWDMDLLRKKKAGKLVQVESSDDISEDSSDDEYDMEKDAWLASLHKFMEERGTPINKPPVLGFRDLNLYKLYKLVQDHGGCRKVTDKQMWRHIMIKMGIPVPATQQPYNIHTSYNKYLFAFEEFNRKMGPGPRVFTRTRRRSFDRVWISPPTIISRQRSLPSKQPVKDEPSDDREVEEESPSKKRVTRKKAEDASKPAEPEESKRETRETKTRSKEADKEERDTTDRDDKRTTKKSTKDDKVKDKSNKEEKTKDKSNKVKDKSSKDDNVKDKVTEKSSKTDKAKDKSTKDEKVKERSKDTPSKDGDEKISEKLKDPKGKDKAKDEKGEKSKEEKGDGMKEERMESKPKDRGKERRSKGKADSGREEESSSPILVHHITGAGYEVGERVLVHYGRGRTEKIYEAKVVDIELKGKDHVFTVHYTGWNNRYDEAVKKSRIMGSAEKKKKKLTPKGKSDKEKSKKDAERRDKEEQQRKEKEEADRREQEENERRAREERELKEKEEAERLEKARVEKERQEKERQEQLEKERKEKQLERERLEKERQEREKRDQEEQELKERLEKERQERDRKEKQEKERKEKQEKDKREKVEREKREKEKLELERQENELADKAREAERERKEKAGKETKKTPTGKRGRPSLSSKTSPLPQTPPRTTPSGRGKSPSPASVFSQRSMRSDRKSLTESPFALGLNVRPRGKRSSTGEYRRGTQDGDSDSELDELDAQYESQQSTQDSEDSQMKDTSVQEPEEHDDNESTKTEDYAATLTKASEEKLDFDEDLDEGPPTLIAEVTPETVESRLQEAESEAPKVEEVEKVSGEREGRLKSKKESKIRLRKSIDKERDVKDSSNEALKGEKTPAKDSAKVNKELDDSKEKIDDTPVLERQIPMEAELKEKLEDLKQESKGSASDADKKPEKKKGRRKGRKSLESRKRSKTSAEAAEVSEKSEASEASEPKKKHAKVDRRKSDKGGKKSKGGQDSKTPADNTDSDFGTSSIEDKSIPGTSKPFMTTPPTTPESSPKMPSSPARDEDLQVKTEYQSSNKSDSDALIEVANVDDRETTQSRENDASLASSAPPSKRGTTSQQPSPKKRRRGISESEQTKKRRKHSRRRQSSISERRHSAKERSNNNSSDTDESRSESRLTSSSTKRHMSLKKYADSLPPSRVAEGGSQDGSQKQRRWNFLVDLSNVKEPDERIAIIQHQLSELRSVYLQLKQEVATIDRRRKKFRKKEREAAQVMAGVALGHCLTQTQDRVDSGGS